MRFQRRPRRPSPFVAAVLSLIFPGAGQLYAGRPTRAVAFAALPFLAGGLLGGILVQKAARDQFLANLVAPDMLQLILVIDVVLAVYRAAAVVDAWLVAAARGREADDPRGPRTAGADAVGRARSRVRPTSQVQVAGRIVSVAGLLAVLLVLSLGHIALGRYDRIAYDTITGITTIDNGPGDSGASPAAGSPSDTGAGSSATPGASPSPSSTPSATLAPVAWNGTDRLNVLLVGTDQRAGDNTFNTDTMIIASIDPASGEVAMFSVPRDTENVPLPPGSAAANYFGGVYPNRINSLWSFAQGSPGLFPGTGTARGAAALKGALGTMLGIDIKYYVMVNFAGFQNVIDTLGGVMIDVQLPVQDYSFPALGDHTQLKLYIPPGIQFMNGTTALEYARARHETNDFDRAQRQQRVITSVRQQTDIMSLLDPNKLQALSTELKSSIKTDYPAAQLPALLTLLQKADLSNLRSFVFTPPVYQTECTPAQCVVHYFIHPKVAAIQQAVKSALAVNSALAQSRLKLAAENATVWVESGTKNTTQAGQTADYLDYLGVGALVPPVNGGMADKATYQNTVVTFYNGAEATMPETVRVLEATFGVTILTATDPTVTADAVVITGATTPALTVPTQ